MILVNPQTETAFDSDVRQLDVNVVVDLTSVFLDTSLTRSVIAGGDYFNTIDQLTNDRVNAPGKRFVLGTSVLGGTDILIGPDLECGWTSDELSGVDGVFATPPTVEEAFSTRTIEQIHIHGDNAWGEYPVDFTVELNYSGAYHTELDITGNTEVDCTYDLPVSREGVTKARLTITKWSKASVPSKIYEFKCGRNKNLGKEDIYNLDMLEETVYDSGTVPVNNVSANQLSLIFDNDGGITLAEMKRNKKITASIGAKTSSGDYGHVSLGEYYAKEWKVDSLNNTVGIIAYDLMSILAEDTYNSTIQTNVTLKELLEDILSSSQLTTDHYEIDNEFSSITVPVAMFKQTTHQRALAQVIGAALGKAYVDRNTGKLKCVGPTSAAGESSVKTLTNASQIMPGSYIPLSLSELATVVRVTWSEIVIGASANVVESTETYSIDAESSEQVILEFPADYLTVTDVVTPTFTQSGSNITLSSYTAYTWGVVCNFANAGGSSENITSITIEGKPVTRIKHIVTVQDDEAVAAYGRNIFTYDNMLVQTPQRAKEIANLLIATTADPKNKVVWQTWGAPQLVAGDAITGADPEGGSYIDAQIERNNLKYNGSLGIEITGRRT